MRKKTMILVAGAVMVLACTAFAGVATAKETKLKCEGVGACTFTVSSSEVVFSIVGGDTVKCTGGSGSGEVTNLNAERESSTGNIQVLGTGCKEQNTVFHFACSNTSTSGNVTTNVMVGHSIALPGTTNEAGVLLTNAGVTFTCAGGFASSQITGSIIGEAGSKCNTNTGNTYKDSLTNTGDGVQAVTTYTGSTYQLESKTSHTSGGTYANAALGGAGSITFNQNVILTCA